MKLRGGSRSRFESLAQNPWPTLLAVVAVGFAAVIATAPAGAASIPAWLDARISTWNASNPAAQIRFVDIKDSFVWYDMTKAADIGHEQIRARINDIVLGNGYEPMDDEERVTTGKPPATMGGRTSPEEVLEPLVRSQHPGSEQHESGRRPAGRPAATDAHEPGVRGHGELVGGVSRRRVTARRRSPAQSPSSPGRPCRTSRPPLPSAGSRSSRRRARAARARRGRRGATGRSPRCRRRRSRPRRRGPLARSTKLRSGR